MLHQTETNFLEVIFMKKLIAGLTVLFSLNTLAIDVRAPQISFNAGEATTFVSVLEVCHNGDAFETLNEKEIFAHVREGKTDNLVVVGYDVLSRPRTFTKTISTGKDGNREEVVTVTLPLNYTIEYYSNRRGKVEGSLLYTKSFSVPACK